MNGQNRNFQGLDAASGLPVNRSGSIVSQMPGDGTSEGTGTITKMGSLPRDSGCPISAAGCKMCQPYHHNGTGIRKKGPVLKELFSQGFAPVNHPLPFSFARCASARPRTSGLAVTFQLPHQFTYWD